MSKSLISFLFVVLFFIGFSTNSHARNQAEKEWTLLVFLNGHNNLDRFGTEDLNEMEKVGSSDQVNVVVQWASLKASTTKRVYVEKDNSNEVTSPVVEDLPRVDMGDYEELVEFIKWGVNNYPAKKYFVDVWNHGSGWRNLFNRSRDNGFVINDISWDDISGNSITTKQLGEALKQAADYIGKPVDIYGSDACLMGMIEVANEMKSAVDVYLGSQDLEPGKGWPYDGFLRSLVADPNASAAEVSEMLTDAYVDSYQGGSQGNTEITFSSYDMSKIEALNSAISELGILFKTLSDTEKSQVVTAAIESLNFYFYDYRDLGHFVDLLESQNIARIDARTLSNVRNAIDDFVIVTKGSNGFADATGVSIWLPTNQSTYDRYQQKYADISFNTETGWGEAVNSLY